jgi:hypothetical protein
MYLKSKAEEVVRKLYKPFFLLNGHLLFLWILADAEEMTKYAALTVCWLQVDG